MRKDGTMTWNKTKINQAVLKRKLKKYYNVKIIYFVNCYNVCEDRKFDVHEGDHE